MSSELNMEIEEELKSLIDGEVRFRKIDRILYSTDASNFQVVPIGVVIPRSAQDVINTVNIARQYGVSILPRGGGTGLAGQSVGYGIVIDFSKYLKKVIDVDTNARTVKVEPGIYIDQLNNQLRPTGLMFGPDPSTSNVATVGGVIGNNGTGTHSILYGMAGDNLASSEIVLHDGSVAKLSRQGCSGSSEGARICNALEVMREENSEIIRKNFPKHWRIASGYSLNYFTGENFNPAKLLASSEGTLGIATELELDLVEIPERKGIAILQFDELLTAIEAVPGIVEEKPSAVELIDGMLVDLTRGHKGYSHLLSFVHGNPAALLIVEFYGKDEEEVDRKLKDFIHYCDKNKIRCRKDTAQDSKQQKKVWSLRKAGLGILMSNKSRFKPIPCIEDVSVPVENLPQYVEDIVNKLNEFNLQGGFYGHASAGCLHIRPLIDLKTREGKQLTKELEKSALELCLKYGGVMSGEHGDGMQRSYLNEKLFGTELYRLMRQLKDTFDPDNLFNPGKVVNSVTPEDGDYRYSEKLKPVQLDTYLDWSKENGFLAATEMCNGQGVCRKLDTGIMCPSYMATRDENDTTRARANTLRAILSGRLSKESLTSGEVYDVFDLCISCKGCGSECPSSVDVAKMKTEYLAQYKYRKGFSLRDRVFGNIHKISKFSSLIPSVVNYTSDISYVRSAMAYAGISSERILPKFADTTFTEWYKNRKHIAQNDINRDRVVYFHDTWTEFYYPEIGKAAVNLLESLGFEVEIVFQRECCGRPMLSKGMVKEARKMAESNIKLLGGYTEQGIPVIGTESSCISVLKDDYMSVAPSDTAENLADNSYLIDEFIVKHFRDSNERPDFDIPGGKVLLHGHCHQRSLTGIQGTVEFLNSAGFNIEESNATCCGMAGSFGYEKEHYDISRKIGEDRLFPAVRELEEEDIVCVAGVSCLEQIEHFTGRKPVHIAELIYEHLEK